MSVLEIEKPGIKHIAIGYFGFLFLAFLLTIGICNLLSVAISPLPALLAGEYAFTMMGTLWILGAAPPGFQAFLITKLIPLLRATLPLNIVGLILFSVITLGSFPLPFLPWILLAISATSLIIGLTYVSYCHNKDLIIRTNVEDTCKGENLLNFEQNTGPPISEKVVETPKNLPETIPSFLRATPTPLPTPPQQGWMSFLSTSANLSTYPNLATPITLGEKEGEKRETKKVQLSSITTTTLGR